MKEQIVQQIVEKTGISQEQAETAFDTVVTFLKSKLPEPLAGQIDGALSGEGGGALGALGKLFG